VCEQKRHSGVFPQTRAESGDAPLGSFFSHPTACHKFGVVLKIFKLDLPPMYARGGASRVCCTKTTFAAVEFWAGREAIQLNAEGIIQSAEIIEEPNSGPAALQTASFLVGRLSNEAVAESGRPDCSQAKLRQQFLHQAVILISHSWLFYQQRL
jgi:hypothetical protein